jgi:hypothetical protein
MLKRSLEAAGVNAPLRRPLFARRICDGCRRRRCLRTCHHAAEPATAASPCRAGISAKVAVHRERSPQHRALIQGIAAARLGFSAIWISSDG